MQITETLQRRSPRPDADLIYSTPFIVRGHHLANLRPIVAEGVTPDDQADEMISSAIRLRYWIPVESIDMIGTTNEEKDFFRETLAKYFERFRGLPSDFPIRIVVGQEDGICSGCAVGNHCAKPVNNDADIEFISQFTSKAEGFDTDGKEQERLEFGNDEAGSPTINTTAGVVKEVLKNWQIPATGQL